MFLIELPIKDIQVPMTDDVPFLRHVKSNKTFNFCMFFFKFVNFVPIDLKIGTHIDGKFPMYLAKKLIDKHNVTYISMATKYPIMKHMWHFSKLLTIFISANNEDIGQKFLPETYDHTLMLYKFNDIQMSKFKVTSLVYQGAAISHKLSQIHCSLFFHRHLSGYPIRYKIK